jgi:hypothetical protein
VKSARAIADDHTPATPSRMRVLTGRIESLRSGESGHTEPVCPFDREDRVDELAVASPGRHMCTPSRDGNRSVLAEFGSRDWLQDLRLWIRRSNTVAMPSSRSSPTSGSSRDASAAAGTPFPQAFADGRPTTTSVPWNLHPQECAMLGTSRKRVRHGAGPSFTSLPSRRRRQRHAAVRGEKQIRRCRRPSGPCRA